MATRGARALRIEAVAARSGAPVGSIYHRFGSLEELLARAWLRAARRSQEGLLGTDFSSPVRGLVEAALATYDFCLAQPAEALTLNALGAAELRDADLPAGLTAEVAAVNAPLEGALSKLAKAFGGDVEPVLLAAIDLPYGAARRHLAGPRRAPAANRERLATAVRGMVESESRSGIASRGSRTLRFT